MNRALGATSAFEAMRQGESQVPSPFGETDKNIAEKERSGLVGGIASLFDYYSDVVDPFAALRIAGETVNTPIGSIPLGLLLMQVKFLVSFQTWGVLRVEC